MKISRKSFVKDLTRTRHMTTVSAVVLGTTFMPLLGAPELYEVRAFQGAVEALSVPPPPRDDEAARQRSANVVTPGEREERPFWQEVASVRRAVVERQREVAAPDEEELVAMIAPEAPAEPLPAAASTDELAELEGEATMPESIEEEPELETLPPIEDPILEQDPVEEEEEL